MNAKISVADRIRNTANYTCVSVSLIRLQTRGACRRWLPLQGSGGLKRAAFIKVVDDLGLGVNNVAENPVPLGKRIWIRSGLRHRRCSRT